MAPSGAIAFCALTKSPMIDRNLILKHAPSNINEQVHVNHEGCEAGEDKKRRLYIKRTDKGLVAYCHHCNEKGFASDSSARLSTWLFSGSTSHASRQQLPTLVEVSIEGKIWLGKYYCDSTDKPFNGIKGNTKLLSLDLVDHNGDVIGYQVRNLVPNAVPKYVSHYFAQNNRGDVAWFYSGHKTLVITEDYLSAYRIHKDTGFTSMALLRTSLTDQALIQICELEFEQVIVWLDSDEAGKKGAKKVKTQLQHFLPNKVSVIRFPLDREPKEHTPAELKEMLL